jgi:hypothetical protein
MRDQILTTSYWLHVELGKNILFNSDVLNRIYQLHNNQGKQLFIR